MKKTLLYISALPLLLLTACSDEIPMVNLGIDDTYYIYRMQKLSLHPALTGAKYRWSEIKPDGSTELLSNSRDYIFLSALEGKHTLRFEIFDDHTPYCFDFVVNVIHEEIEYSPYISRVYEYCPAPGQYINEMPRWEEGDTYANILQKAEESIQGKNDVMISLGGYGGYVTFGFDHTVMNVPGEYDFRIWGNCFYELLQPDKKGGSAEPGIVCVSYDVNCNGLPDDPWYELAGSEYYSPATMHGYSLTYTKPDPNRQVIPDEDNSITDLNYIGWSDNRGQSGFMPKNLFHTQDYWPKWIKSDKIAVKGSLLAPNGVDISGMGTYYVLYSYPWGYADNHPNEYADLNSFKIEWAVDANGKSVHLPGIDFVRVYTGLRQQCGWLGETSTEISKAQDLHIKDSQTLPNPF